MTETATRLPIYKRRSVLITAGVLAIPILALAWWLGSPLFLDTVADEAFPVVSSDQPAADDTTTMDGMAAEDTLTAEDPGSTGAAGQGNAAAGLAGAEPVALR